MPAKKTDTAGSAARFEKDLARLEGLVEKIENGELSLEESLQAFEEGVKLARRCQSALANAEQKVQKLTGLGDASVTEPLELSDDSE